jgi:hypothetical protein
MADKDISVKIKLQDEVSKNLKQVSDNVISNTNKIKSSHKNMAEQMSTNNRNLIKEFLGISLRIGIVVSAYRVFNAFKKESIELAKTQLDSEKRLETVLRSTGWAAGYTKKELMDLSTSLQKVTTYGDETINVGNAMLLTFTNIGKKVLPLASEMMLNLSTVMDTDLKSSAIQLGKALNDPVIGANALRRVGVRLTDQQTDQIKKYQELGDIESAQMVILNELETEFGGVARAMSETDSGAIKQAQNEIGDLREELGENLLPATRDWYNLLLKISRVALPKFADIVRGTRYEMQLLTGKTSLGIIEVREALLSISNMSIDDQLHDVFELLHNAQKELDEFEKRPKKESRFAVAGPSSAGVIFHDDAKKATELKNKISILTQKMTELTNARQLQSKAGSIKPIVIDLAKERKIYEDYTKMITDWGYEAAKLNWEAKQKISKSITSWGEEEARLNWKAKQEISKSITSWGEEAARLEWENQQKIKEDEKKILEERAQNYMDFGSAIGSAIGQSFNGQEDALRNGLKGVLRTTLQFLEKQALAAIVGNQLKDIMTLGPAGLFKAAGTTALISGIFSAAEASIGAFQDGGIVNYGSTTGDRTLARVNRNEAIFNKKQQAELFKLANGKSTTNNNNTSNLTVNLTDNSGNIVDTFTSVLKDGGKGAQRFIDIITRRL